MQRPFTTPAFKVVCPNLRGLGLTMLLVMTTGCPSLPQPLHSSATKQSITMPSGGQGAPATARGAQAPEWLNKQRTDFYGVYLAGQKVGYARMEARPSRAAEPGEYARGVHVTMEVKGPHTKTRVAIEDRRYYGGEAPFSLVAARFEQMSSLGSEVRELSVSGKRATIQYKGDRPRAIELPTPQENLQEIEGIWTRPLTVKDVGRRTHASMFDWEAQKDLSFESAVKSVESMTRSGVSLRVARVEGRYVETGLVMAQTLDADGVVLEMTMGAGLLLKLEEERVAKAEIAGLDVMTSVVPFNRRLAAPEVRQALELTLLTPAKATLPAAPGQSVERLTSKPGDEVQRWKVRTQAGTSIPAAPNEQSMALAPSPMIDSEHLAIQKAASAVTRQATTPKEKAEALAAFVFTNLTKRLATHIPSASSVLEQRVGDCTEHTWLFVALCRAAGIPARPAYGLMYLDGEQPAFGYHAWAEVVLDGRWVAVDPTWNQFPADGTHIKLGSDLAQVAMQLGGLAFEATDRDVP